MLPDIFSRGSIIAAYARLVVLALLGGIALGSGAQSVPQWTGLAIPQASTVPLLPSKVALTVAEYVNTDSAGVVRVLRKLGAEDISFPDNFSTLSPFQQVQWGYASVEAKTADAGKEFVSAFVQVVAEDKPSIQSDPDIWDYVSENPTAVRKFSFVSVAGVAANIQLDPDVSKVIALVSDVVASRGSSLTVRAVMERNLGLSTDDVVEAMVRFKSGRSALADYLAKMPNPPQKQKLAEIARDVMISTPAARSNAILGEAVFRWIGLDDAKYGEWFRIRDKLIDSTEQGRMNAPDAQKAAARAVVRTLRYDAPRMIEAFLRRLDTIDASNVERMFFEYASRKPSMAALWGFGVIGLMSNFDYEPYIPGEVEALQRKGYDMSDLKRTENLIRKHGPKPHHGYLEYVRITGFQTVQAADAYFTSSDVQKSVGDICPVQ